MPVRLMIVDDHESVRELLRAIVADAPEDVVVSGEADGAATALETIDRIDPDVVVLDERMPDVSGLEAAPLILERRPDQKILLFSAVVDAEICDRAERAGIAVCLSKDDLDEVPRVAFELAFAVPPGIPSVRVDDPRDLPGALRRLGLGAPRPVVALVGGASGLEDAERLHRIFTDELVPVVRRSGAAIVDGATDAGVVALVGRASAEEEDPFPLVGVAVEALIRQESAIEPHHTHLLLVPGERWGDETPWLAGAAGVLAGPRPCVTVLVEGGEIALADVEASVAAGRRVIVVAGSGRTADALAGAAGGPRLDALRASGLVESVSPRALATVLAPILEAP